MTPGDRTPGEQARREVLGDAHVDAALVGADAGSDAFQAFVTERAWGEWARPDLGRRERSLLTIGVLAALGRTEELTTHFRGAARNGLTDVELDEVLRHVAAYAGVPAAVAARRALVAARATRETEGD
jgi:alkylhydroperoxidase/carboxymuconolactone decarboxylase family protein YurZ